MLRLMALRVLMMRLLPRRWGKDCPSSGDERNHKVTTMDDVPILEFYMTGPTEHRVGSGYDVHELMEGRKLVLGGVTIPYEKVSKAILMQMSSFMPSWMPC